MRDRYGILFLLVALLLPLGACHDLPSDPEGFEPPGGPSAEVNITGIRQSNWSTDNWGCIYIDYDIVNTGPVDISYYEIYFRMYFEDGFECTEQAYGLSLDVNECKSRFDFTCLGNRRCIRVEVERVELTID